MELFLVLVSHLCMEDLLDMLTQKVIDAMRKFGNAYGTPFTPCQLLLDMAKSGDKFYKAK